MLVGVDELVEQAASLRVAVATIDFYYDVVCPYAYLASTQVEAMARRRGATLRWKPILLGGLLREIGAPVDPNRAMPPAKRDLLLRDRQLWAAWLGVPLEAPHAHPQRTVAAMRLALAAPEGPVRVAVSRELFAAYWVEGRDIGDRALLASIAERHGLASDVFEADALRNGLRDATAEAKAAGAFGVPSFVVDGRVYWGQDRMSLVERALGGAPPRPPVGPSSDAPDRLTVFHDFASPFSYLASTQLPRIAAARGMTIEWVPILLGALFREIGTPNVPLLEMNATKQAYVRRDLDDWAQRWGVPFRFPEHFPLRSVLPLRAALVDPAATEPIYRAVWAQGARVDTPEGLGPVLDAAGLTSSSILQRAGDPEIKAQLRTNTERARAAGLCGVPTFEVQRGDRSLSLWGQDRLELLEAVLDGFWPPMHLDPRSDPRH